MNGAWIRSVVFLAMPLVIATCIGIAVGGPSGMVLGILVVLGTFFLSYVHWNVYNHPRRIGLITARRRVEALSSRRLSDRRKAARVLRGIGPNCEPILPQLLDALRDEDALVRDHVIDAIGSMGTNAKNAVPALVAAIRSDPCVQMSAVLALRRIGAGASKAVPVLIELLDNEDIGLRIFSADALWRIDKRADLAVPIMVATLSHDSAPMRRGAAHLLGEMGAGAEGAIPSLLRARNDRDRLVRKLAADAVAKIRSE